MLASFIILQVQHASDCAPDTYSLSVHPKLAGIWRLVLKCTRKHYILCNH